ncbi:MAG: SDR family NAD(P)-dependent oxidoreductase [Comamonas sp.]
MHLEVVKGGTALVTGASSGYGEALTRALVADGWRVIAVARRLDKLKQLQLELGDAVYPLQMDVSDPAAVDSLVSRLPAALAHIDLLVNNAGVALGREPAQQALAEDWAQMIAVNVAGLAHVTQALLPGMVQRGRGHIVNIGSIAAQFSYPGANVYGATKAFVRQFTMNLKADLLGTPVRVSVVEPGMTEGTEFSNVRFKGDESRVAAIYEGTEALKADDVAQAVLWIVSRPAHVNVTSVQLMPVCQAPAQVAIHRKPKA